jgi:hypothetical protein
MAHASDIVDWGQLGATGTLLTTAEPWTSAGGLTGLVGIVGTAFGTQNFRRDDQGNNWAGDFTPGDHLLFNQGGPAPDDFGILFNTLTFGGGLQIQPNIFGAFDATVTAFDSVGDVLGTATVSGNSTALGDGSAPFLSFQSASQNVSFLEFSVNVANDSMAIDSLEIFTDAGAPEPGSIVLLGTGLLLAIGYGRRRLQ